MKAISQSEIQFSNHGMKRIRQRGISPESVISVIRLGEKIHRQNMKFFYIPKAHIKELPVKKQQGLINLVVITDQCQQEVITCYKNEKAIHRIRKKTKRLRKYSL